ncbi:shikimate kinase [Alphaproteobacteria bacterium KMM 3653]|uniref:Shikimate kinase n=1 Tax=Harenicola maris TaxID=2841044 RepID=A0AAP2CS86_9RHOB|nr:shikimate kinase [Harenicola maris]
MQAKPLKTIALVGMMGSGKTAVGTALARMLDIPFVDSDQALVAAADRSIAEIFERDGEAFFRTKERQVITRLLTGPPCVLSTGGGAFLGEQTRAEIKRNAVSVFLDAELELLWSRVRHKTTRPLLMTERPKATLTELMRARAPVYALADLAVKADPAYQIEDMARAVLQALQEVPGLWDTPDAGLEETKQ